MSRRSLESAYNKSIHDEDVDSESNLRAQHEALSRMAEAPQPLSPPSPVAGLTPLAAPSTIPAIAPVHPAFHRILATIKKSKTVHPIKIATASKPPRV